MSSLARVLACPPSALLPATRATGEGVWQGRGRAIHAYLRDVILLGPDEALCRVPDEHREVCEGLDLAQLPVSDPSGWAPEVAFAYDWTRDTAREVDRGTDSRDYGAGPTELAGRADVVGLTDDAVSIVDYKTGYRWLGSAYESMQMRGYALAAARSYGRLRARVTYARILDNGRPWFIRAELDEADLDETAVRIRRGMELVERLRGQSEAALEPHLSAGEQCRYCPAFSRCPEQRSLLSALVRESGPDAPELEALTDETAPAAYVRFRLATALLARLEEKLQMYAETSPIPLGNGLVYGRVKVPKETLDPAKGALLLAARYGAELAEWAIESAPILTKASLERGLRRFIQGHKELRLTKLKEEALAYLRESGASRVAHRTQTREHRPGIATEEE